MDGVDAVGRLRPPAAEPLRRGCSAAAEPPAAPPCAAAGARAGAVARRLAALCALQARPPSLPAGHLGLAASGSGRLGVGLDMLLLSLSEIGPLGHVWAVG